MALLASCAFAFGALGLAMVPAMAGCNSGDVANGSLLSSSDCRSTASGVAALAVGDTSSATALRSIAFGLGAYATSVDSVAVGALSGSLSTTAIGFIAIGAFSGERGTGRYSTAIGGGTLGPDPNIGSTSAAGDYSIAIGGGDAVNGNGALAKDAYGVAIGTSSMAIGVRSTAVGAFAGNGAGILSNRNSAFGEEAGQLVNGAGNTATGLASGYNVAGNQNLALGNSTGGNVTGNNNAAGGFVSGVNVNGTSNAAYGDSAGRDVTGDANIAIGQNSGRTISASNTIAVGTNALASGASSMAIGAGSKASALGTLALGQNAVANKLQAVAIGSASIANVANTVSVGRAGHERRIMNVATAVNGTDAVNLAQVQALIAAPHVVLSVAAPSRRPAPLIGTVAATNNSVTLAKLPGQNQQPSANPAMPHGSSQPQLAGNASPAPGSANTGQATVGVEDALEPSTIVGWANVSHDGALSGARNIAGNAHHGIGDYEIAFKKASLLRCTYHATPAGIGIVTVKPGPLANSIRVETRNNFGALTDAAFYLMAVC